MDSDITLFYPSLTSPTPLRFFCGPHIPHLSLHNILKLFELTRVLRTKIRFGLFRNFGNYLNFLGFFEMMPLKFWTKNLLPKNLLTIIRIFKLESDFLPCTFFQNFKKYSSFLGTIFFVMTPL